MEKSCVSLKIDRNFIDSSFDGYKLSLDSIPIYKHQFEFQCENVQLSDKQYSFQHVKAFGAKNLLFGDPWDQSSTYYIDTRWKVMRFYVNTDTALEDPISVLQIPGANERSSISDRVNASLMFVSEDLALLSTGTGALLILETFNRREKLMWKVVKSIKLDDGEEEEVGSSLLNGAHYVEEEVGKIGCVLASVREHVDEEKDTSTFFTHLHWLTLAPGDNGEWHVACRRQLEGRAAPDYAAVEADNRAIRVASEKPFKLVYDSLKPLPIEEMNGKEETKNENQPAYVWGQNDEEVSVQFRITESTTKSDIQFKLTHKTLELKMTSGQELLSGELGGDVDVECSTWTMADSVLEVLLSKKSPTDWKTVVEGDDRGKFVLDGEQMSAIDDIARLGDDKPAYNVQELEDCDMYPDEASVMVRYEADSQKQTHQVNLGSNQWLMNCGMDQGQMPCICLRHDVDGVVWQPSDVTDSQTAPWKHVATFNAFGYVQASKQQRRFTCCSPDFAYAVISDAVRHIYIYRQPSAILSPLRNRKTGREVGAVAKQHLVSLESVETITGVHVTRDRIFALAGDLMHVIRLT